jgi:GT2 family glycosyltransferase
MLWASTDAVLELPGGSSALHLIGGLPPGPERSPNTLTVTAGGVQIASIENSSKDRLLYFNRVIELPRNRSAATCVFEFATRHEYVPRDHGHNGDRRHLGFCLKLAECVEKAEGQPDRHLPLGLDPACRGPINRLRAALALSDAAAPVVRFLTKQHSVSLPPAQPGISIVIPERGSPDMLDECLGSIEIASHRWPEPLQVIVAANGIQDEDYSSIRSRRPWAQFLCHPEPLTFCQAVRAGLKLARHDWVYLLNNDMVLDSGALDAFVPERSGSVFALASRIVLADQGLLPYETNWTSYRVREELLEIFHAAPPEGPGPFEILFGGGGCTLYRRSLLERYIGRRDPYAPFYFEDLDWATRGWQDGFSSLLCAKSVAIHRHRATINRFYGPSEAQRIFDRNQLQYQLRHIIEGVSRDAVLHKIAESGPKTIDDLTGWRTILSIAKARLASGTRTRKTPLRP